MPPAGRPGVSFGKGWAKAERRLCKTTHPPLCESPGVTPATRLSRGDKNPSKGAPSDRRHSFGIQISLLLLLAGTLISVVIGNRLANDAETAAATAMDRRTDLIAARVRSEANRYVDTIRNVAAAASNYDEMTATSFDRIAAPLRGMDLAGAVSLVWLVPVADGDVLSAQRFWEARGFRGTFQPIPNASEHYFVVFNAPLGASEASPSGLDSAQAETPSRAIREARRTGAVVASDTYELIRDRNLPADQRQRSFVLVAPVNVGPAGSVDATVSASGWLVMSLRGEDFMSAALQDVTQDLVDVTLSAPSSTAPSVPVAQLQSTRGGDRDLHRGFTVPFAQQVLNVDVRGSTSSLSGRAGYLPTLTTLVGLVVSMLVALLVHVLAGDRARAEQKVRDATRKIQHANQEIRDQAVLLGAVVSTLSEGVSVVDAEGRFLVHNQAARRMLLVDDTDDGPEVWQQHYGLYLPDGKTPYPTDELPLVRALAGQTVNDVELVVRSKRHNEARSLSVSASPLNAEAGRSGAVAVFRDVTEERERMARLEKLNSDLVAANRFNEGLFEAVPDATIMVNSHGSIVMANRQTSTLFGYDVEELLGMDVDLLVPREIREAHRPLRESYEHAPKVRSMGAGLDLHGQRKDGSLVPLDILLSPLVTPEGHFTIAAIRDVTERRHAEARLRAARHDAERASRAKSDFLSRMSHELRTPLAAVLGFAGVLEQESDELVERHRTMVHRIDRAGRHLLSLINDVLDISRIESGQLSLSSEPVRVSEVVANSFELTDQIHRERSLVTSVEVEPALYVLADRSRLQQIIVNLLSNAGKYNRDGGSIRVTADSDDDEVRLLVTDTGMGIDSERLSELFMPFARLGAEQTKVEGTGLGLTLSKALAEQMNGRLEVFDTGPQGTTFLLALPPARPNEPSIAAEVLSVIDLEASLRDVSAEIVYVEDNPDNVAVFTESLASFPGLNVHAAADGATGIEMVKAIGPDLVFVDLHLPDMDGRDVIDALRRDERLRDIPVVVLTADAIGSSRAEVIALGADGFLTKPFSIAELLSAVQRHLLVEST